MTGRLLLTLSIALASAGCGVVDACQTEPCGNDETCVFYRGHTLCVPKCNPGCPPGLECHTCMASGDCPVCAVCVAGCWPVGL